METSRTDGDSEMPALRRALAAWGTADFKSTFQSEVEQIPPQQLPLQQGLTLSSYVSSEPFRVMLLSEHATDTAVHVKAGIFYTGIIAGCSCSDDPSPTDVQPEYCELDFEIRKDSGQTRITLLQG